MAKATFDLMVLVFNDFVCLTSSNKWSSKHFLKVYSVLNILYATLTTPGLDQRFSTRGTCALVVGKS